MYRHSNCVIALKFGNINNVKRNITILHYVPKKSNEALKYLLNQFKFHLLNKPTIDSELVSFTSFNNDSSSIFFHDGIRE